MRKMLLILPLLLSIAKAQDWSVNGKMVHVPNGRCVAVLNGVLCYSDTWKPVVDEVSAKGTRGIVSTYDVSFQGRSVPIPCGKQAVIYNGKLCFADTFEPVPMTAVAVEKPNAAPAPVKKRAVAELLDVTDSLDVGSSRHHIMIEEMPQPPPYELPLPKKREASHPTEPTKKTTLFDPVKDEHVSAPAVVEPPKIRDIAETLVSDTGTLYECPGLGSGGYILLNGNVTAKYISTENTGIDLKPMLGRSITVTGHTIGTRFEVAVIRLKAVSAATVRSVPTVSFG